MTEDEFLEREARRRGMSITQLKMQLAVDDRTMRDIVNDQRHNPNTPSSPLGKSGASVEVRKGSGWSDPRPLSNPPGVALADRLMDQQDRIDRAIRERMLRGLPPDDAA